MEGAPVHLLAGARVGGGGSEEVQNLGNLMLMAFSGGTSSPLSVSNVPEHLLWTWPVIATEYMTEQHRDPCLGEVMF